MASRLVMEWTRATARLAVAEGGGGRLRLRAFHSQPLSASGAVAETLRALRKTQKAAAAQVVAVVPREQVITRVVKFPTTEPGELAHMVELYAKAQLPYPQEQTVMDFYVLGKDTGFTTVTIVACQREVIERQLAVLREAGIPEVVLAVSSWGVMGWYQGLRAAAVKEPVLIVNIDDARTDLVLLANGRILSSRSVGQGSSDWDAVAGDSSELLVMEVERSRAAIRKELPGTEVQSVVVTGLGPTSRWSEQLSQRLGVPAAATDGREPFGEALASIVPVSPVVAGGLAVSDSAGWLTLNPPEVRVQARHRRQLRELALVGALMVGVVMCGSGVLALQAFREQQAATRLDRAMTDIGPTAKQVQEKTRSTQVVRAVLGDRRRLAAMLSGVLRSSPANVTLEGLTFERTKRWVVLRGSADSTQAVLEYIKQLERFDEVAKVELKYSTQRTTPSGPKTDFEIVLHQANAHT